MTTATAVLPTRYTLAAESELRCEVGEAVTLKLKLVEGNAEIFGIEMAINKEYIFQDENFAVFSWYGCIIESVGGSNLYTEPNTPMVAYVNTHSQLEARRDVAVANNDFGPRVILVGDSDKGKSSTARILAAYAARLDRNPIFVDLDVGQGSITIPGCISAVPLEKLGISIEEGLCHAMPLVYYHGYLSPNENVDLYQTLVTQLAARVDERMANDKDAMTSGMIINTCGWVEPAGVKVLIHCIQAFRADVVLVMMGQDRLFKTLEDALTPDGGVGGVTLVKLPTSGGVVKRDRTTRLRQRKLRIQEYFNGKAGVPSLAINPRRRELSLDDYIFLKAGGGGADLTDLLRPIGESSAVTTTFADLVRVTPSSNLAKHIVGVLHPPDDMYSSSGKSIGIESEEVPAGLIESNICGFLHIIEINLAARTMHVLSPCEGGLPSKYLLVGDLKWHD